MKARDIIIRALRRSERERGLRLGRPNHDIARGHMEKADHDLVVMTDLAKLGHEDWVVATAYYAMYQSALSLLAMIGLASKDHSTTAAVLEHIFGGQVDRRLFQKFNRLKERKEKLEALIIQEKYIDYLWEARRARETVQYGVAVGYRESDAVVNHARVFVTKMKLVASELDEALVEEIGKELRRMSSGV
jgi:uncharacterized protein (UPF0332 family)